MGSQGQGEPCLCSAEVQASTSPGATQSDPQSFDFFPLSPFAGSREGREGAKSRHQRPGNAPGASSPELPRPPPPQDTVNADDPGVRPQTPAGSCARAVTRRPGILRALQLLEDELEECGGRGLGEVLGTPGSGTRAPRRSVATCSPRPASPRPATTHTLVVQPDPRAWGVGVGASGPSALLAALGLLPTGGSWLGSGAIYF